MELLEERRAAERKQRSALDELLIANARKSPEQIELATGIPAQQALERLAYILRARDWMTERQEERLLLIEMGDLVAKIKDRLANASEQYFSDTANAAMRGYEAIAKRMEMRKAVTEEEMSEITRVQAEVYIEVLREVVTSTMDYIAEVYPEMDVDLEAAINSGFQRALPVAFEKIRSHARD
jgi:hypothetical protein